MPARSLEHIATMPINPIVDALVQLDRVCWSIGNVVAEGDK